MAIRDMTWILDFQDHASRGIKSVNDNVTKASANFKKMGEQATKVGKTLSKTVTAPIVAVGAKAIHSVASFDDGMSKVMALTGATGEEFESLRKKAIQLGNDTAFSAQDASEGMQVLASAGRTTNEILAMSGDMFTLMSAASVDADTSANVLNKAMAQFKLEATDSTRIVDAYAKGQAESSASVENLEYILGKAGSALATMNMTMEDSVASAAHLANAGMPVAQIGTGLSSMTREIKANADAFRKKGIHVYDQSTGKLKTLGQVMEEVNEKTKNFTTDQQRDKFLADIFSGQGAEGATAWLEYGIDKYHELSDAIYESSGTAQEMADTMEDNIGGAFRSLSSSIGTLFIGIGDVLKDPVKQVAEVVQGLADRFNNLDDDQKKLIVTIGGVAAAIGPVLMIGGKAMALATEIAGAINPVRLVLMALAAATIYLWNTNEEFRDGIISIWENIKSIISSVTEIIGNIWESQGENIMTIMAAVKDTVVSLVQTMATIIGGIVKIVAGVLEGDWSKAWDGAKQAVSGFIEWFTKIPDKVLEIAGSIGRAVGNGLKSAGKWAVGKVAGIFGGGKADGSHRTGLTRVPFDGYRAILHKDEEVLRKDDPRNRNFQGNSVENTNITNEGSSQRNVQTFSPTISINIEGNTDTNTVRQIEEAVNNQMNLFFKKMNLQRA